MTEKRRRNSAILPAAPPPHPSAAENLPILLRSLVLILILIALLIIAVSLNSGSLIKSSLGMAKTCLVFVLVTRPIIGASVQNQLLSKISLILTIGLMPLLLSADPAMDAGKKLFKNNCAQCHAKNMKSVATGPALGGAQERWADYPQEDLYAWIRNSQALVAQGHPRGVAIYNEYNKSVMQPFPNLTDEDISSLLAYIDGVAAGVYPPKVAGVTPVGLSLIHI